MGLGKQKSGMQFFNCFLSGQFLAKTKHFFFSSKFWLVPSNTQGKGPSVSVSKT